MLSKFHTNLLSQVKTMSDKKYDCVVSSLQFSKTKQDLNNMKISYVEYPFTNSFYISENYTKLLDISELKSVEYLSGTTRVSTQIYSAKKFLNLSQFNENKYFGNNITIAIIDTGLAPHLDFVFPKYRVVKFVDLINNKPKIYDDNGHGTFVASICAGSGIRNDGKFCGIAPLANLVIIKALDKNGETDSNKILDAMQFIYLHARELNIKVVCMSFGAEYLGKNDPLQKGANALWNSGITVVAAAGNSGPKEKTIKSPGTSSKIITVGGLDSSNNDEPKVADFSSRGPANDRFKPDLLAPSINIIGAGLNKDNPYTQMSGTSVATPIIAGLSAILLEKNPRMSPDRVKFNLLQHCKKITNNKNEEGYGYLKF